MKKLLFVACSMLLINSWTFTADASCSSNLYDNQGNLYQTYRGRDCRQADQNCNQSLRRLAQDNRYRFGKSSCVTDWRSEQSRPPQPNTQPNPGYVNNLGELQFYCNCRTGKRCYMKNGKATKCIYECPNGCK